MVVLAFGLTMTWALTGISANQPKKVLILPFKMNSAQNADWLQNGIYDMLSSRIKWPDKVDVIAKPDSFSAFQRLKGNLDEASALSVGREYRADYVLYGSVTMMGQDTSLDATMLDLAAEEGQPPLTFYGQTQGMNGVIPKINEFVTEINAKVFGRGAAASSSAQATPAEPAAGPEESLPAYRRHPDYLLTGREGQQLSPLNPNFIVAVGADAREGSFWRSPFIRVDIIGLDVGDVDGDGRNEVVYATKNAIFVGRVEDRTFKPVASFKGNASDHFLSLDLADLNGNGRPEIFVSSQRALRANSYVFEVQDNRLTPIVENFDYYFRVVYLPHGPKVVGQKGGVGQKLFYEGVKIMAAANGTYVPEQPLVTPKGVNLFNFAKLITGEDQKEYTAYIDHNSKLVMLSPNGEDIWSSAEDYCATPFYMELPLSGDEVTKSDREGGPKRVYTSTRIIVADLNADGRPELILAKNEKDTHSKFLERWQDFKNGSIFSLSLVDMALRENWRSRQQRGFISDYQIADYDNNGSQDLVASVVTKSATGATDGRSVIVAFELATPEEMRQAEEKRLKGE